MTGQKIADNDIYSKNAYIDLIHNCNANIAGSWERLLKLNRFAIYKSTIEPAKYTSRDTKDLLQEASPHHLMMANSC